MSNPYLNNLNRIEFVMTYACTGNCKHCSEGEHIGKSCHVDGSVGARAVKRLCEEYKIDSLMTFGGEPLLCFDDVFLIHSAARDCGILKRQLITNGYFTNDSVKIHTSAEKLKACGVNMLLLSVDAFHQETIPLEPVTEFAKAIKLSGIPIKTNPAWLVSREDTNPYNIRTSEILSVFDELGIAQGSGNIIFPAGNALKYLREYFEPDKSYINPYDDDPSDLHSISVSPDGSLLGGNIITDDILKILENYIPTEG